jgi:hypothetical protein
MVKKLMRLLRNFGRNFQWAVQQAYHRRNAELLVSAFRHECEPDPTLRLIGSKILEDLTPRATITPGQLVDEFLDRARPYYHTLWSSCSTAEKLVLIQLAKEGLINPYCRPVLRELLRKRLIVRSGGLRLMNESFRRFVLSVDVPKAILDREHEAKGGWRTLKIMLWPILLIAIIFLALTQQKHLEGVLPLLTAMAGGITALWKILDLLKDVQALPGRKQS